MGFNSGFKGLIRVGSKPGGALQDRYSRVPCCV